jgi:toxin FitB
LFEEDFAGRVLPFDREAAVAHADVFAAGRRAGRLAAMADLMIASIARSKGARVATLQPFRNRPVDGAVSIDVWSAQ